MGSRSGVRRRCILPEHWLNALRDFRHYLHDLLYYCDVLLLLHHRRLSWCVLLSTDVVLLL